MDFGSVIIDLIRENSRIILMVFSGLLILGVVVKIFSILKEDRAQEKVDQGRMDQLEKSLNQIFSELQEIRYAIYELKIKDKSFTQGSEAL